ncbi:hypothetical protein [Litchfieldia alkalitelluris]|uniref:hypothetical protein n=1 Tax=Litchfieldia alkalitelluris TaxID=304268 RepID=UPI000997791B|nr:hypothetical protein [Litchfieldia alkalitelluris]
MILKSIDLSLMTEHLNFHKGILSKLEAYFCTVQNPTLKQIIYDQYLVMRNHVKVMMLLIDPDRNDDVTVDYLNKLEPVSIQCQHHGFAMTEQNIAMELRNTAKTMAHDNFSSALRMKTQNVRDIHIHMSLQQTMFQHRYNQFTDKIMMDVAPKSSVQEQKDTLHAFKKIFNS